MFKYQWISHRNLGNAVPGKLDDDLKEKIAYLKERYPRMGAAAIFRQLKKDGSIKNGQVSKSTVNRYVNRLSLGILHVKTH